MSKKEGAEQPGSQQRRLEILRGKITGLWLISSPSSIRYLSGFTGSDSLLAVSPDEAVLFTDGRYTVQAESELCSGCRLVIRSGPLGDALCKDPVLRKGVKQVTAAEEGISLQLFNSLSKSLQKNGVELVSAPSPVVQLRRIKERGEIKKIEEALRLTEEAFIYITAWLKPGCSERETAAELEHYCRTKGAERASFEFIVAAGERGALPHGVASERIIGRNETVLFDFGIVLNGYCSDFTRVLYTGKKLPAAVKKAWEVTAEAQQIGFAALAAGVDQREPDRNVYEYFKSKRRQKYYTHSLGHGVGLDIHEQPRLSRSADPQRLQAGNVVTVEPGLYYPGRFGVRLEDVVVVEPGGARRLTCFPLDIPCLDF